jgi:hypothetical protein
MEFTNPITKKHLGLYNQHVLKTLLHSLDSQSHNCKNGINKSNHKNQLGSYKNHVHTQNPATPLKFTNHNYENGIYKSNHNNSWVCTKIMYTKTLATQIKFLTCFHNILIMKMLRHLPHKLNTPSNNS